MTHSGNPVPDGSPGAGTNRLIHEKSPYLLAHARNPVDWYPWGDEAFSRAAEEDKPIFLSIGYATCHWCHVMAHESFESPEVADVLNRGFVSIKVDREERPDIDSIYMEACQRLTGHGGWPLTIIMTPDKKPFFAGTYYPREGRFGTPGLIDLLNRILDVWTGQRDEVLQSADRIVESLASIPETGSHPDPGPELLDHAFEGLRQQFDPVNGGFGTAPKFPVPLTLLFLLRYWKRTGNKESLSMVDTTLAAMARGGICDHIGRGFHRYSTDAKWQVPHFEKMLYDQALLLMAYTEAFHATKNPAYRDVAEGIIAYVARDLTSPHGAFYSAEDADSPGGEGAFYLWTLGELEQVLGPEDAAIAAKLYSVTKTGNFPHAEQGPGRNILFMNKIMPEPEVPAGQNENDLYARIRNIHARLFEARQQRARPLRDDKILADWNGLMIAALALAARVFRNDSYRVMAERARDFILARMHSNYGGLLHRYQDGEAAIPAFCEDYAYMVRALLELYETTFDPSCIAEATRLQSYLDTHFRDAANGGYYSTAVSADTPLVRKKEIHDMVTPSGNSATFENLIMLARLTGNSSYEDDARDLLRFFAGVIGDTPTAFTAFLMGLDRVTGWSAEVRIVGSPGPDTEKMLDAVRGPYLPTVLVTLHDPGVTGINDPLPFSPDLDLPRVEGKTTAYVCTRNTCAQPVTDPEKLPGLLGTGNGTENR
jgi:hypothetical protein